MSVCKKSKKKLCKILDNECLRDASCGGAIQIDYLYRYLYEGNKPLPISKLWSLKERCKLSQRGQGRSLSRQIFSFISHVHCLVAVCQPFIKLLTYLLTYLLTNDGCPTFIPSSWPLLTK